MRARALTLARQTLRVSVGERAGMLTVAHDSSVAGYVRGRYTTVWLASVTVTTSSGVLVVPPSASGWNSMVSVVAFTTTRR